MKNKGIEQREQHRAPKKKHSWKWHVRYAWNKASPYVRRFCWFISKTIVWLVVCGIFIVLTRVTGWQRIVNILTENITPAGILRDILLVMLGVTVGRSFPKRKKVTTKKSDAKMQLPAGQAQADGQAKKQE